VAGSDNCEKCAGSFLVDDAAYLACQKRRISDTRHVPRGASFMLVKGSARLCESTHSPDLSFASGAPRAKSGGGESRVYRARRERHIASAVGCLQDAFASALANALQGRRASCRRPFPIREACNLVRSRILLHERRAFPYCFCRVWLSGGRSHTRRKAS
jgi:hypothetical protein